MNSGQAGIIGCLLVTLPTEIAWARWYWQRRQWPPASDISKMIALYWFVVGMFILTGRAS